MVNKHENINKYIPNQSSVGSKSTNVSITRNNPLHKTALHIPGLHSAESCALNAGIYAANTAYSDNRLIRNSKKITAKDGLAFSIYHHSQLLQDGISTSFADFNSAFPGLESVNYTHIHWVGYFYVTTLDPCNFVGRNISMWIGDYAFRLYNNSNTNLSKKNTNYTYTPQKVNTYIPIRLEYKNDRSNDFTFSCKQNITKPTFSFVTLYNGCDVYYTNQVLYSIVKNRSTPRKYIDKDNYFDCTIYGRNKNGNQIVSDSKKPFTNKKMNTNIKGNPSIPFTYHNENQIALNVSTANPKMGRMYIDNSKTAISNNNSMFSYGGSKDITYNTYENTYPLSNNGKNRMDLQSCKTNCTNDSRCKGFYFGQNIGGFSTCNTITNAKNITYLPQQLNQTNYTSSTLYTKNPKANNTNIDISFNVVNYLEPFSSTIVEGVVDRIPIISNNITPPSYIGSTTQSQKLNQDSIIDPAQQAAFAAALAAASKNGSINQNNQNPLLLQYTFNSSKNTNSVTTKGYDSKTISTSPAISKLNNGITVSKSTYRNSIQLPSFKNLLPFILTSNGLKPISLSINFKPQIVTKKAHQIWRIFDFNGKDTFFQLYIVCDKGKVTTLYCKSKVQGSEQAQDIAIDLQNMCSMNSWNNIIVVFHANKLKLFLNKKELKFEDRDIFLPHFDEFTNNRIGSNIITKEGFQDGQPIEVWENNRKVGVAEAKAAIKKARSKVISNHFNRLRQILIQRQKKIQDDAKKAANKISKNTPKINMPKINIPKINVNGYIEEANDFTRKIRNLLKNVANKAINEINSFGKAIENFFKNLFRRMVRPKPPHYNDTVLFYDFRFYNVDISVVDDKGKSIMSTIPITPGLESFSNININQDMQSFSFDSPSYSIIEGAIDRTEQAVLTAMGSNAQANINEANRLLPNYSSYLNNVVSKQLDLSQNITNYNTTRNKYYGDENTAISKGTQGVVYSFDSNGNIIPNTMNSSGNIVERSSTTRDVIKNDLDTLIVQQNTVYVTGTIACATLLIAAIMIGSK